ncbi:MAG: hypothetical protein U0T73_09365 [Chitinophagales bacterium]
MSSIATYAALFAAQELIALPLFYGIRKYYSAQSEVTQNKWLYSVLKGVLERFVLYIGFINELPGVVTFFGAVKLGTRLDDDKKSRVSNDYFLVGNLTSILLVTATYLLIKKFGW